MKQVLRKPVRVKELSPERPEVWELRSKITSQLLPAWTAEVQASEWPVRSQHYLLEQFISIADAHLADKHFGVKELVQEIKVSRTHLHRKLKAATGQSANGLLRIIRLQKALLLLQSTGLPVTAVSYRVGFSSASHFAKIFEEYFGFLPHTARKKTSCH